MKKAKKGPEKKERTKRVTKERAPEENVAEVVFLAAETPTIAETMEAAVVEANSETAATTEDTAAPVSALPAETLEIGDSAEAAFEMPVEAPTTAEGEEALPVEQTTEATAPPTIDLDGLRKPVEEAKAALDAAEAEMKKLVEHARVVLTVARDDYRKALAPYRDACRKAGRACEFEGGRGANVAARVGFLVERTAEGVCITIRGRPETVETIPLSALKESVGKAAYSYCDRWLGPKESIGNKGGGLGNRIRAVLK